MVILNTLSEATLNLTNLIGEMAFFKAHVIDMDKTSPWCTPETAVYWINNPVNCRLTYPKICKIV